MDQVHERRGNGGDAVHALAFSQGVYFLASGVWPLVHMRSFEKVTGPKADKWLVNTVGILVSVVGGVLILAGVRRRVNAETMALAAGCAAGLGAVDVLYASRGRISPVYLADAAVEGALLAAWGISAARAASPELHDDGLALP